MSSALLEPPLLEIRGLEVDLRIGGRLQPVIRGVDLALSAGEAVGLVGESGSGKSMTVRSIMQLLPPGAVTRGWIRFDGEPVDGLRGAALRRFRSRSVAMVFQDPRAHINPVRTVGDFLTEGLIRTHGRSRSDAEKTVVGLMTDVGIPDAARRLRQRPYELSGGLLQRVMIAAALAIEPRLILADEPTTALDVTTQEEVMAILDDLRRERGLALLFITHDLELAAAVCDRTAVMYAGRIVETAGTAVLHADARHPYTRALLSARTQGGRPGERLRTVPGNPQAAYEAPSGCAFRTRCPLAIDACTRTPELRVVEDTVVACHRADEIVPVGA